MRQQLRQPDGGPMGRIKRATLKKYLIKKESWKTASGLTNKGQKAARQRKNTTDKKGNCLLWLRVMLADGRC
jgi:hypothetical protein